MGAEKQLPEYKVFIRADDFRELKRDIWIDDPVPAQVSISGKRYEIDLSYRGSHIRDYPKKSYEIGFSKPKMYNGSRRLHLNAEYKDPSLIRNKLSFDFFSEIGTLAPSSEHILLFLNGKQHGVYLAIESVDEYFLKRRGLQQGSIHYAVDGDANFSLMSDLDKRTKKSLMAGYERKSGRSRDNLKLQEMIFKVNTLTNHEFGKEIQNYVDVDKYLRWIAGVIFTSNYDGFVHNYALYRNDESGLFEVIPWDYDATWGRDVNGKVLEANYVPIDGFNTLTARILGEEGYRKDYQTLLKEIMNHQFTVGFMMPKVEGMLETIRPYVLKDPYKKNSINQFDQEGEVIKNYIEKRREYLQRKLSTWD